MDNNGQLLEFHVSRCRLDINDCAPLKHILTANKNLNRLKLSVNTLSADALRFLQPSLASSQLRRLDLARTRMDAEGARLVGEVLADNPH